MLALLKSALFMTELTRVRYSSHSDSQLDDRIYFANHHPKAAWGEDQPGTTFRDAEIETVVLCPRWSAPTLTPGCRREGPCPRLNRPDNPVGF